MDPKRKHIDPKVGGGGFNNLAAGNAVYGGGRPSPNSGGVSNAAASRGYAQRDNKNAAKLAALQKRAGR